MTNPSPTRLAKIMEDNGTISVDAVRQQRVVQSESVLFDGAKMEALHRWASTVAAAGMWGYKSADEALVAVLFGLQLGMGAVEALSKIKVLHGTPTLRGPAAVAHIRSLGGRIDCITGSIARMASDRGQDLAEFLVYPALISAIEAHGEDPEKVSVWRTERDGHERIFWYGLQLAHDAGLTERNAVWRAYPSRMIKWQAASEAAQEIYGDWLLGAYFTEEMEGSISVVAEPSASAEKFEARRSTARKQAREASSSAPSQRAAMRVDAAPQADATVLAALREKEASGYSGDRPPLDARGEQFSGQDMPALDGPKAESLKRRIKEAHAKTGIAYATVCKAVAVDPRSGDLDRTALASVANMYQFVSVEMQEVLDGRTFTKGETVYGARHGGEDTHDGTVEAFFEDDSTGPEGERIALVGTLQEAARMCVLHAHGWEEVGT